MTISSASAMYRRLAMLLAGVLLALAGPGVADASGTLILGYKVCTAVNPGCQKLEVLVQDGRIVAVEPSIPPDSSRSEDPKLKETQAQDQYLTPGLIGSYSQLGLIEISLEGTTNDTRVRNYPLGPGLHITDAINPDSALFDVNRLGGITAAMVFPRAGNDPIAGHGTAVHLGLGRQLVLRESIGLAVHLGRRGASYTGDSRAATLLRLRHAFTKARRFKPSRYHPDARQYSAQDMAALKAYLASSEPLVLFVNRAQDILAALKFAREAAARKPVIIMGGAEGWKVADALAMAGASVVLDPMQSVPGSYETLGSRMDNAALLNKRGVQVAFAMDDTHNLRRLRFGAGNAVANGLNKDVALAAITRVPAEIWGLDDLGSIAPGKRAHLVLWDGDPFEVTTTALAVMIDGAWMPMESRQSRLTKRYMDLHAKQPFGYR